MAMEACDWCPEPATKSIEDFRGYGYSVACDAHVKYAIRYVLPIDDPRCGDYHDGDDPEEGGVSEPAGDSPDNPPTGESRVPGGSDDYLPVATTSDYPSIAWPALEPGVIYEAGDSFKLWMGPDGTWHSETVRPVPENSEP